MSILPSTHEGSSSEDLNIVRSTSFVTVELRIGVGVLWQPAVGEACFSCFSVISSSRTCDSALSFAQHGIAKSTRHAASHQCHRSPVWAHICALQFLAVRPRSSVHRRSLSSEASSPASVGASSVLAIKILHLSRGNCDSALSVTAESNYFLQAEPVLVPAAAEVTVFIVLECASKVVGLVSNQRYESVLPVLA